MFIRVNKYKKGYIEFILNEGIYELTNHCDELIFYIDVYKLVKHNNIRIEYNEEYKIALLLYKHIVVGRLLWDTW